MPKEELPPLQYRPPKEGLLAKVPTELYHYYDHSIRKQGLTLWAGDEKAVLDNPLSREMINNDGSSTLLVHGTSKAKADKILAHGLGLEGQNFNPDAPDLFSTIKMMAPQKGPGAKDATNRNIHALAYRYDSGDYGQSRGYKVVAEMAVPNPGTSLKNNPFEGTAFDKPDGVNIVAHDGEETAHGQPFSIPSERIRGYFDIETGEFTHNERFVAAAEMIGHATLGQQIEQ